MSLGKQPPYAKRSLGQNFLVDQNYIRKIITAADPQPADTIIEIGPGRGAITESLVDSEARVIAIELDSALAPELAARFKEKPNFHVIEADATQVGFSELLKGEKAKVVANLPYYISTAILQHLAAQRGHFISLVLMFQKEVVERITAPPGSSERGFLTVLTEKAFHVEHLFDVPPAAFRPVPKVVSSVVRLIPKPLADYDESEFRHLVSVAFAHKRKTLLNNLKQQYPDIVYILERSGVDSRRRAESLSLDDWSALFKAIKEAGEHRSPSRY
jgi:16S rRNA (adenine1518-N6/adenine1519-N6)-dimethyltransferase